MQTFHLKNGEKYVGNYLYNDSVLKDNMFNYLTQEVYENVQ